MTETPDSLSKPHSESGSGLRAVSTIELRDSVENAPAVFLEALASGAPCIIASWPKNSRETMQVKLDNFKGQAVIDCRAWYAGADGELKPGRGGLTISVKHLPALAAGLANALDVATSAGILKGQEGGEQ